METLINTVDGVQRLIDNIEDGLVAHYPAIPFLFVDLEGVNLGRQGSISLMQLLFFDAKRYERVAVIDIRELKDLAFDTRGKQTDKTLRYLLESAVIGKAFFDVRNDSDALFAHYKIRLQGVEDVQLMECMTRHHSRRLVNGFKRCLNDLPYYEQQTAEAIKSAGKKLFAPECGGSYAIFDERPLPNAMLQYCLQDVTVLYKLWKVYEKRVGNLSLSDKRVLAKAVEDRIVLSQSYDFCGKGQQMCLSHLPEIEKKRRHYNHFDDDCYDAYDSGKISLSHLQYILAPNW